MRFVKFASISLILLLSGCAGMQTSKETSIESIQEAKGRSKDQIYSATKAWFAENFHSAKSVIDNDDKEAGIIIGKGSIKYPCNGGFSCIGRDDVSIGFIMRIDIKDQKFKTTYTNITFSMGPSGYFPKGFERPVAQDEFDISKPALLDLSVQLQTAIEKEKTKANW